MADLESPEAFAERLATEFTFHWYSEDTGGEVESTPHAVEAIRAYAEAIRADERAKVLALLGHKVEALKAESQRLADEAERLGLATSAGDERYEESSHKGSAAIALVEFYDELAALPAPPTDAERKDESDG